MESISNMSNINVDPQMSFYNRYQKLKSKYRLQYDDTMYANMGWNVLLSMFKYDDKIFRPELFDRILHDTGVCSLIKTDTSPLTPVFTFINGGERYADGFFKNVSCFDMTGKEYNYEDWRNNPEIQVFFNNLTYSPDIFIEKYSYMLSELDTSITCNVIFSRLKPIPIVKDSAGKAKIDQILADLVDGKIKTIIQELDLTDIVDNNRPSIEVLNLTDVESSKYIQYLQHLHDNLISRLFFMMGLSINDTGKQAQISIEELNKNKDAAISLLNGWYTMRKRGFDEMRAKGMADLEFDFSDVWKSEIEVNVYNPEDEAKIDEQETEAELHGEEPEEITVDSNSDDNSTVDSNSEDGADNDSSDSSDEQPAEGESSGNDVSSGEPTEVVVDVNVNINTGEEEITVDSNSEDEKEDEDEQSDDN